jgi:hypothetical protein
MEVKWFYQLMGTTVGPLSLENLRADALDGTIAPDTLIRHGDRGAWVLADKLPGLFDHDNPIRSKAPAVPSRALKPAMPPEVPASMQPTIEPQDDEGHGAGSEGRYPSLHQYLSLSETAIELGTALVALALLVVVVGGIWTVGEHKDVAQLNRGEGLAVASLFVFGLVCGGLLFVAYVGGKAAIEFIQVVVDVEKNTRRIAARLKTSRNDK